MRRPYRVRSSQTPFLTGPRLLSFARFQIPEGGDPKTWEAYMKPGWGVPGLEIRTTVQASQLGHLKKMHFKDNVNQDLPFLRFAQLGTSGAVKLTGLLSNPT